MPQYLPTYLVVIYPLLAFSTWFLMRPSSRNFFEQKNRLIIVIGTACFFIAALKFGYALNPGAQAPEAFNFHHELIDVMHGGFFTHPTELRTEFAIHFSPVLFLLVPFFKLFPHPIIIFAVGSFMMSLAIPAAWRFLKIKWSPSSAALLAFGIALYPSLLSLHRDFSPVRFAPLAIILLLTAYREKRIFLFCLSITFCWMVKETLLLAVIMMGVIALFERRNFRWVIFPSLIGAGLFILTNNFLLPWFAHTPQMTSTIASQFGYWGRTATQVLVGFANDPVSVFKALFRLNNLAYLFKLCHPVLFLLPFGSPIILAALPEFLVNTMAGYNPSLIDPTRPGPWTSLVGHYSATIGTIVWLSATEFFAPKKNDGSLNEKENEEWYRAVILFLAVLSSVIYPTNAESL